MLLASVSPFRPPQPGAAAFAPLTSSENSIERLATVDSKTQAMSTAFACTVGVPVGLIRQQTYSPAVTATELTESTAVNPAVVIVAVSAVADIVVRLAPFINVIV